MRNKHISNQSMINDNCSNNSDGDNSGFENVHMAFLNLSGFESKLLDPEFHQFISATDIVGHMETHPCDSGGVALEINNNIKDIFNVKVIHTDNTNSLWCKFSNFFAVTSEPLIVGVCYISPQGSLYSSQKWFADIESEYLNEIGNYKHCLILGDFNSHIRT